MRNASRLLRRRVVYDPNTEVDGALALTVNCSAVICVGSRGCSSAGSSMTSRLTAAILKLTELRH
jgi:hypothetical protein